EEQAVTGITPDRDLDERAADLEALTEEARQRRRRRIGAVALLFMLVGTSTFVSVGRSASGSSSDSFPGDIGGFVSAFAFDPRAPDTVYVATSGDGLAHGGRVYKTTDAGEHWRLTNVRLDARRRARRRPAASRHRVRRDRNSRLHDGRRRRELARRESRPLPRASADRPGSPRAAPLRLG